MAGRFPDDQIAATLNRLGLKTGSDNNWIEMRVRTARSYHELPSYDPMLRQNVLTLEEASERLGVSHKIVRRLIDSKIVVASQVVPLAAWEIPAESIKSERVLQEIAAVKRGIIAVSKMRNPSCRCLRRCKEWTKPGGENLFPSAEKSTTNILCFQ